MPMPTLSYSQLFTFTESIFRNIGCP